MPLTNTLVHAGNLYALPEMTFEVGGNGTQLINWTITNNATGDYFTLAGSVMGGDEIVVNSVRKTVLIGTTDRRDLFNLLFLTLVEGANEIEVTRTAGILRCVTTTWQSRWE